MNTLEDLIVSMKRDMESAARVNESPFSGKTGAELLGCECLGLLSIAKRQAKDDLQIDFGLDVERSKFYLKVTLRGKAIVEGSDYSVAGLFAGALVELALLGTGCFGDEINKAKDLCRKHMSDLDNLINSETPEMSQ